MIPVKLLTFMLVSSISVQCVYSEPVGREEKKSTINPEGCGVRTGKQYTSHNTGQGRNFAVEDILEDDAMYDDTGMESRVVGIFDLGVHACGGSIIDDRHVLTAAHCFDESTDPREYVARIGELRQGDSRKSYQIEWIKVHQDYSRNPTYFNDIALLRLREPIPHDAVPICLPMSDSLRVGDNLTIIGFGAMKEDDEASDTLQEVDVPVMANSQCDEIIRSLSSALKGVRSSQICTGDEKGGKSSCQGDSGGPVIFKENDRWYLLGLVSYSAGCARPGIPTVHTRVSAYRQWIDRGIAEGGNTRAQSSGIRKVFSGIFGWF